MRNLCYNTKLGDQVFVFSDFFHMILTSSFCESRSAKICFNISYS